MARRRGLLALAALPLLHGQARAESEVDLLLALAVDASGSVTEPRFILQRQGYADAFRSPRLHRALTGGPLGAIGVCMYQWTGPGMHVPVLPWTRLGGAAHAIALAARIEGTPRALFGGGTSISGAIDHGMRLLSLAPFSAARRVIDVSGDGANNRGRPVTYARDEAVAQGVTINGLPIMGAEWELDTHYREQVIGGPGAFMIVAESFETFGAAVLRKLVTEVS